MPSPPLALSDSEMDIVFAAASPLKQEDRDAFLKSVVALLAGQPIGPGTIFRACLQAQRQYFRPPDLSRRNGTSKW
jgi:hypothetical protein